MSSNINTKSPPFTNSHFPYTNDCGYKYLSIEEAAAQDYAHDIREEQLGIDQEKQTCLDNIRNGRESLKKIIGCFSSTMPKLNEFKNNELKDCALFIDKLIEAKEEYYASNGLLGKIKSIFSCAFGSIKDATSLKHKFNSITETQKIFKNITQSSQDIASGAHSLTKIIDTLSTGLQKSEELESNELQECLTTIQDLIKTKEDYFDARGKLGKILMLFSRAFGSLRDAAILKHKIDSNIENQKIVDKLSAELELLHKQIVEKQHLTETKEPDIRNLVDKFEITLIHLSMFSKNEKHAKIFSQFVDTWQNLF